MEETITSVPQAHVAVIYSVAGVYSLPSETHVYYNTGVPQLSTDPSPYKKCLARRLPTADSQPHTNADQLSSHRPSYHSTTRFSRRQLEWRPINHRH